MTLTFDAVSEAAPGPKWAARWQRSWPAYEVWFVQRGGDRGPSRDACRAAMKRYMPELLPVYDRLVLIAGGSARAARFLSTWCPPTYLGGCSIAAAADNNDVRLVRNYDLSPELNEGLLPRTEWTGRPVMGMVEFLWGLSDGLNDAGLCVALAYGGRSETGTGFGITTILRYILETCDTVAEALGVLHRVPSHMAYNLVLADASGHTASVELSPGGGVAVMPTAIATNHQSVPTRADRPAFTRSFERHTHLEALRIEPRNLNREFLRPPLKQNRYSEGFGTLFTAEYDPVARSLGLTMQGERWDHALANFEGGTRKVHYSDAAAATAMGEDFSRKSSRLGWSQAARLDWTQLANDYASGKGKEISDYLPSAASGNRAEHRCR